MNELSKRLYAEGWTKDNHPDNVLWGYCKEFEYKFEYLKTVRWETPCGLCSKTIPIGSASFMGIDYMPENNNPLISCPYRGMAECKHVALHLGQIRQCAMHMTDKPYDYEFSVERIGDDFDKYLSRLYKQRVGEQICINVNGWDDENNVAIARYIPRNCFNCKNEYCYLMKQQRDLTPVNIYFDVKRTFTTKMVGTLTPPETKVTITKGEKLFKSPVHRTDAEMILKRHNSGVEKIRFPTGVKDARNVHFSEYHGNGFGDYETFNFKIEYLNIRVERHETRDILEDLSQIAEGNSITHASDNEKAAKAAYRERKQKRKQAKQRKEEKRYAALKAKYDPVAAPEEQEQLSLF